MQCPYCTNPLELAQHTSELDTQQWVDVLDQARKLGAVQLGLSGGEPLVRKDLEDIVAHARSLGFYSNLITTGIGLTENRVSNLKSLGLDHIQLSIQDKARTPEAFFSHTRSLSHKKHIAGWIKGNGFPMVVNIVLHRHNIDHTETLIRTAIDIGADDIELANAQYHGWAFKNRHHLVPTRGQVNQSEAIAAQYREKYKGKVNIFYVVPDYFEGAPKPCMSGWGTISMSVAPSGTVMPCLSAAILPGLDLPNVRNHDLQWIWRESDAFNKYRGEGWMKEPCKSCSRRSVDYGGCRCQAYMITGDARNADPACNLSPHHGLLNEILDVDRPDGDLQMRNLKNSRKLSKDNACVV